MTEWVPAKQSNSRSTLARRCFVKGVALGGGLIGAGLWQPRSASATERGIVGKRMPAIQAKYWIDPAGKEMSFSMSEVRGKWVFIKCFQNWCPGCHKYGFPTLKKVADAFGMHPQVTILGIQTVFEGHWFNTQSALRDLQLKYDLPVKMGHDVGSEETDGYPNTMINYRTGGTPWIIVANPSGQVIFNGYHLDADRFISYLNGTLKV